MTCGKHRHKGKYFWNKEGANIQKFNYCKNPDKSRNTVRRESRNKNEGKIRAKITRRNPIIPLSIITKKVVYTRRKRRKNNMQTKSQKT